VILLEFIIFNETNRQAQVKKKKQIE